MSPEIREAMAETIPLAMSQDDNGRREDDHVDSGALIPWDKADGTAAGSIELLGIRTVIMCLVMCNGRVIADGEFQTAIGVFFR
jgi:hypothetical protein